MQDIKRAQPLIDMLVHSFGKTTGRGINEEHPHLVLAWRTAGGTAASLTQAFKMAERLGWVKPSLGQWVVTELGEHQAGK